MKFLAALAWISFVLAALCLLSAFTSDMNSPYLSVASAVSLVITGAVFLAMDRALFLLSEIRGTLWEMRDIQREAAPKKEPIYRS
ncbi:hypothetical protein [Thioclava sp. GXIMD2076]|uniref:hypothetical protein n=1 Tax=Thioclava sp. GXIMD2076 TaxID=3131931 RepID=UPI0030CEC32B